MNFWLEALGIIVILWQLRSIHRRLPLFGAPRATSGFNVLRASMLRRGISCEIKAAQLNSGTFQGMSQIRTSIRWRASIRCHARCVVVRFPALWRRRIQDFVAGRDVRTGSGSA